jgi:hypothetical protein
VVSALVNNLTGWLLVVSLVGGAVLTVLAVGLPMVAERRAAARAATAEDIAEVAVARMQLVLDDALEPPAYLIGRITDLTRRSRARELQELQGRRRSWCWPRRRRFSGPIGCAPASSH